MTPQDMTNIQRSLGLSDSKMAAALGVTRQTLHNWRTGRGIPPLAQNAMRWMVELRKLSPHNENLPKQIRCVVLTASLLAWSAVLHAGVQENFLTG